MDLHEVDAVLEDRGRSPSTSSRPCRICRICAAIFRRVLRRVSEKFEAPLVEVFRLANFYNAFSLQPRGRHLLTVCTGTACHVRGAPRMLDSVVVELQIRPGETTTDRAFTVETVNCLGACALGPVVVVDGTYHDDMTPSKLRVLLEAVRTRDQELTANV